MTQQPMRGSRANTDPARSVVVGVDGSEQSQVAVRLAVDMAARQGRPVRIVHAFIWPLLHVALGPAPDGPPEGGLANDAQRIVDEAVATARAMRTGASITGEVITGSAAPVLIADSVHAHALVLGHRGLGGFTGLLVGSVAVAVAAHAICPVVVARGEVDRSDDILVGVDGSPGGAGALGFAFEEAAARKVGVTSLHAYRYPVSGGPGDMLPLVYDAEELKEEETALAAEAVSGWREQYPDVTLTTVVVGGPAAKALVAASADAAMVVVGSRGRGGFTGLLLGSVSHALLHHASCPVAIVR